LDLGRVNPLSETPMSDFPELDRYVRANFVLVRTLKSPYGEAGLYARR
jgi:hypothetical protein